MPKRLLKNRSDKILTANAAAGSGPSAVFFFVCRMRYAGRISKKRLCCEIKKQHGFLIQMHGFSYGFFGQIVV